MFSAPDPLFYRTSSECRRNKTRVRADGGVHHKSYRKVTMKRCSAAIILSFLSLLVSGQDTRITGSIFHDLNNNGQRDNNEPGIPGVAVSDQVTVVTTDAKG